MSNQIQSSSDTPSGQLTPIGKSPSKTFVYNTNSASDINKKKAELLPLYNENNPLLLKRIVEVDFTHAPNDLHELAERLIATMNHYGGAGLAANQCGVVCRMFVMAGGIVVINPTILESSQDTTREKEGCLTFPGLIIPVVRSSSIRVSFHGLDGQKQEATYTGLTARVFQHEYDHLEGKLYTSKVGSLTLQMAKKKKQKLFKKIKRIVDYKNNKKG